MICCIYPCLTWKWMLDNFSTNEEVWSDRDVDLQIDFDNTTEWKCDQFSLKCELKGNL